MKCKAVFVAGEAFFFFLGFVLLVPACDGGVSPPAPLGSQSQFCGLKTLKQWKLEGQKDWWVSGGWGVGILGLFNARSCFTSSCLFLGLIIDNLGKFWGQSDGS